MLSRAVQERDACAQQDDGGALLNLFQCTGSCHVTQLILSEAGGTGSPKMLTRMVLEDGERPQRVAQLLQRVLVQHLMGLPRCGVQQVRAGIEVQLHSTAHSMSGLRLESQ